MNQDEALKRALDRLEKTAEEASQHGNVMLVADLSAPINCVRGVIAEREKAEQPSTTMPAIAVATAATVAALAVVWAGFYAVHMIKGTWMEVPVVITASVLFGVSGVIAIASVDIAKGFKKGST